VRDKIAASKRKGLWVGGPVPLGYRCIDKKLVVVPEEAEVVRTIFTRYLELGSMGALIAELDRQGIRTKVNGRRDGRRSGGIRFGVGSLAHLLKNRFYIGEVTYRGEVHLSVKPSRRSILMRTRLTRPCARPSNFPSDGL
jgi:site-specific DNA recombinase